MAGDDFGLVVQQTEYFIECGDEAVYRAAACYIDVRIAISHKGVAGVEYVGFFEVHDDIAIGVAAVEVEELDVFVIEVKGHFIGEGDEGPGVGVSRRGGFAVAGGALHHTLAYLVVGHDGDAKVLKVFVTSGVVAVDVGVDEKAEWVAIDSPDGCVYFIRKWSELVVDHKNPVGTGQHANITAGAFEHEDVLADGDGVDVDGVEVLLSVR